MQNLGPLILPVKFLKRVGEPPKWLDGWGRWRRRMGMKQILVMIAVVVLVAVATLDIIQAKMVLLQLLTQEVEVVVPQEMDL